MSRRFLVIAIACAGCSLFVDLHGLHEQDASAPTDGAAPMDVTSPALDSGRDVVPPSDAGAGFPCPDASIVCDNFDESPLGARWSGTRVSGATLLIDDDASLSPPNSLSMTLPPNPSYTTRYARLEESISNLTNIDCEMVFRLDQTSSMGTADVSLLQLTLSPSGFSTWSLDVNMQATVITFEQNWTLSTGDAGAQSRYETASTFPMKTWKHLRFKTDLKRAQVLLDNSLVYDKPLGAPLTKATGKLYVGMAHDGEPPSWAYRVDNVLCVGN